VGQGTPGEGGAADRPPQGRCFCIEGVTWLKEWFFLNARLGLPSLRSRYVHLRPDEADLRVGPVTEWFFGGAPASA